MKTLYTTYNNFAKRLVMSLIVLMTVGVGTMFADTYTWTLTSGDLGTTGSPFFSVKKDNVTWTTVYTWGASNATKYFGWDGSDSKKGVQIGAGSSANKCTEAVFSTSDISGTITNITVNGSHASSGGASIVIKVGGETVKSSTNFTTTAADYSTGTISKSGEIEITISNSQAKAFYIKSISITYSSAPACTYTVKFNGNGNTGGSMSAQEFTCGESKALTANAFTKTGHTFAGWATTANGSVVYNDKQSVNLSSTNDATITLYAQWTPNKYTVNFTASPNGYGSVTQAKIDNVPYGTTVTSNNNTITINGTTITATPADKDANYSYSFSNWTGIPSGNKVTANCTITANFTSTERTLTNYRTSCSANLIQLDKPTGLNVTNITSTSATLSWSAVANASGYLVTIVDDGDLSADVPNDQTSYTFDNLTPETEYLWTVKAIGDKVNFTDSEESETGEFTTSAATFTITYDANDGEGTAPSDNTEYTSGANVTIKGNYGKLTKDGYAFTGWNTAADGSGATYKAGDQFTITTNTPLFAQWCEAHWVLVTNASELKNDTRIIIAAKDNNVALSTNQKTNNRGEATITKKYNTVTFGAEVQTLSLVGLSNNLFALYTGSGYLYAAGSDNNNHLKTSLSRDDGNDNWEIAISQGAALILAQGTNTNNQLKYNSTSTLFSCYGSGNSQKDVVIYKEVCKQDAYNVTSTLTNATAANTNATTVSAIATSLTLKYTANTGYLLPETITVKMGGVTLVSGTDYTWDKANGQLDITVDGFYGDIVVTIVAEADPCYGFEMSTVTATSTTNSITLTWTAVEGATGYKVRLKDNDFTTVNGTTHTFTGLSPKTSYTWEVTAINASCESEVNSGNITTAKETFTVNWIVNGNIVTPYETEQVTDGENITEYPTDPSAPSGCSAKVFVGWTNQPIQAPTNDEPTLYTKQSDVPEIIGNTTLYAVWADETPIPGEDISTTETITCADLGYSNGDEVTTVEGKAFTINWNKGTNSNAPKYYDIGAGIRAYGGNYFTISSENTITAVSLTFGTGEDTNEITTDLGTYSKGSWSGSSKSITFTVSGSSGHRRISQFAVTYLVDGEKVITYSAYTTLCDNCTPSDDLVLEASANTADLDINGKATITFSTTGGNGGAITYTANPKNGVSWENGVATFTKSGEYEITATQEKNGNYCPTVSNTLDVTITAIPHLYFTTEPNPTTIVFDPVECGGHTRLEDKKTVSVQGYNLESVVTVTVTGPYKIARTSGATLNEYDTKLTLDNNQDGHINGNYDDVYILSFPPAGSSEPTEGTLTFTTTNGNEFELTVSLSTPTITCTPCSLTFNDRGIKTTQEYYAGTEVPEPATPTGVCGEYEFDGWALAKVESGSTTYEKVTFPYTMPANSQTVLHAVYKYTEGPTNQYELVTEIESGKDYVIAAYADTDYALTNQEDSQNEGKFISESVECDANDIITTDNANIIWKVTGNDEDGYKFYNSAVDKYLEMYRTGGKSILRLVDDCTNPFAIDITIEDGNLYVGVTSPNITDNYNVFSFYNNLYNAYRSCDYNIYFYKQTATPLYTTTPDCHPSVTLTSDGEVYVTATNGRGIMAATPLTLTTTDLAPNTQIAISSNSNDIYFSTERNTNFAMAQANQPKKSLTLTTDEGGELETPLFIHYKPSTDGDGTPAEVVVTADVSTHNPPFTAEKTIHVRNMSAKFVIATKAGDTWYALPANMNGATNPAAVVIEVDETTMTAVAPNTTPYTLWPVATINGNSDRYKGYGERLRFAAINNSNKGLWANNAQNGNTINNNSAIEKIGDNPSAAYEWKVTTTVVDGQWQYTLYSDQDKNKNHLCYSMHLANPVWGTYASNEAMYQLYFLPIKAETTPFDYQVIEWYPNKVLIQTSATFSALTAKIAGQAIANVQYTSKDANQYEVTGLPLLENPAKALTLEFVIDATTHSGTHTIPVMISGGEHTISGLPVDKGIYNNTNLVVRDGAKLTVDGETAADNTFYDVTIYPTAKISVPEGKQLSVHRMTFLGGISEIYNGSTYELNKYGVPQLSLMGTLGKTVTTMDYIMRVNLDQMYQVGVPYDVALADIKYWDGSAIKPGTQLYVSTYDGQARANLDMSNTWRWEVDFAEEVLKAGVGYTISAEPQVEGDAYSILRMPMKNNIASGNTEESKRVPVIAYANQHSVQIADNHKGWNYLSNPYMTAISGGDADSKILLGSLQYKDGSWELVNTGYRYVTIPDNDGEDYDQQKFSEATLLPFKSFFLQIATDGEMSFALASRQNAPARYMEVQTEQEVEFEILLSNEKQSDNTGLLIAEQYSPAYEINADLEKMTGTMSVYTIYNGYNLAYNALSPLNAEEQIPVGFVVPANGEYTFDLKEHGTYDRVEHIYLIDRETDAMVDLLEEAYSFYTAEKKNNNRFAITVILKSEQSGGDVTTDMGEVDIHSQQPQKFFYDSKLYILRDGKIYSATGHEIQTINQ